MVVGELAPGSVFASDYRVIEPLRQGGMGSLYVVEQLSTAKRRALKLMQPDLAAQPGFRRRFELEARIGARIPSDHVVDVIASGIDDSVRIPWLVMELLEGQDLAARLRDKGPASLDEAREILAQLCHALGEAHKRDIVHRDIKPENIFLAVARRRDVPFTVKVLDFGIARIVAETRVSSTASRATQTSLGTPLYMAPEQADAHGDIGPPTDVWPIGLIAFELLTGKAFWRAAHEPGSILMLATETLVAPIPSASLRANEYGVGAALPPGFDAWFARCVDRDASHRYANATLAFAALEPVLRGAPPVVAPSPRRTFTPPELSSLEIRETAVHATTAAKPVTSVAPPPAGGQAQRFPLVPLAIIVAVLVGVGLVLNAWLIAPRSQPEARLPADGPPQAPRTVVQTWRSFGIPECDYYMRVSDCVMRDYEVSYRVNYFQQFTELLRDAAKASPSSVAKACKEQTAQLHPTAKRAGCMK